MYNIPEILAPCGNMTSLKAAVAAGADACYLAGNSFGARAYAANFDSEELLQAIEFAHLHGVKIYLTINTLVKNEEMKNLYNMLVPLYERGLDAVLVQDFGVLKMVREFFPLLPVHSSTQMNILTSDGASFAKELGISRVVAAREMSLREMKHIKDNVGIEIEAFVHGAMCVCYSGRCLMSSMAGGRSGNRGRCAQPCRQRYAINDKSSYKLSMRDMCTLEFIPDMVDAGIDSFKIEGRMKNEYYVAACVDAYKSLTYDYINGCFSLKKADEYEKKLLDTFNRGGFTDGYLMRERSDKRYLNDWDEHLIDDSMPGRRGVKVGNLRKTDKGKIYFIADTDIFTGDELLVDDDNKISLTSNKDFKKGTMAEFKCPDTKSLKRGISIYRTRCQKLNQETDLIIYSDLRLPSHGRFVLRSGKPVTFSLEIGNLSVTVEGDTAQKAVKNPISDDTIRDKISSMGDSDFYLESLDIDNDCDSFIPLSQLKSIRREAAELLRKKIISEYERNPEDISEYIELKLSGNITKKNFDLVNHISVATEEQLQTVVSLSKNSDLKIDYIYLDMAYGYFGLHNIEYYTSYINDQLKLASVIIGLPFIRSYEYKNFKVPSGVSGFYVRSIDDLAFVRNQRDKLIILANSVYAYNDAAISLLDEMISSNKIIIEQPVELSEYDISRLYYGRLDTVRLYYGKIPLMISAALCNTTGHLTDDKHHGFDLISPSDMGYNILQNDRPVSLFKYEDRISSRLYLFTNENKKDIIDIFSSQPEYIRNRIYTTGHFEKGI